MEHNQGSPQAPEPPHWAVAAHSGMAGADTDPGELHPAGPPARNRRVSFTTVAAGSALAVTLTFAAGWILASSMKPPVNFGATGSNRTSDEPPAAAPIPSQSQPARPSHPPASSTRFLRGKLLARNGTQLVIAQNSGQVTVTVDGATRIDPRLGGSLSELSLGERVYVAAREDSEGALIATVVADHPFFGGVRPDGDRDDHEGRDGDRDGDRPPAIAPTDSSSRHGDEHASPGDDHGPEHDENDHDGDSHDEEGQTSRPDADSDQWRDA